MPNNKKKRTEAVLAASNYDPNNNNNSQQNSTGKDSHDEEHDTAMIPSCACLPGYLTEAFGDLYGEDGLICFGKGLQWLTLLTIFVRYYAENDDQDQDVDYTTDEASADQRKQQQQQDAKKNKNDNNSNNSSTSGQQALQGPRKNRHRRRPLVLVLGLRDSERSTVIDLLESWGTPSSMLPVMITTESGQAEDRTVLYRNGGVVCITSRILIVDLLTSTVTSNEIDGILVAHAEHVTEQSTEAFIIRIYQSQRSSNNDDSCSRITGFVKGFSDAPDQLVMSSNVFNKVDKVLKALHVPKLYLYPRFHHLIRDELESPSTTPIVVEFHQPLSPLQKDIQNSIAAAVVKCLRQLKNSTEHYLTIDTKGATDSRSSNGSTSLDDGMISVENCVTSYFDRAISKQLEPVWHKLTAQTKQLVTDLRTLRTLLNALLSYDCVSFYNLLCSIQSMSAASRYPALWLLDPAADVIYKKAKQRVYTIIHVSSEQRHQQQQQQQLAAAISSTNATCNENSNISQPLTMATLKAVLEENPKWKLLKQVLNEIQQEHIKNISQGDEGSNNDSSFINHSPANIVVMVKDDKTMESVKSYLTGGRNKTVLLRWLRYLELYNDRSRTVVNTNTNNHVGNSAADMLSEESRLLIEEEGRVRRILFGSSQRRRRWPATGKANNKQQPSNIPEEQQGKQKLPTNTGSKTNTNKRRQLNEIPNYIRKQRRVASEKGRGQLASDKEDLERRAVLEEAIETVEHEFLMNNRNITNTKAHRKPSSRTEMNDEASVDGVDDNETNNIGVENDDEDDDGQQQQQDCCYDDEFAANYGDNDELRIIIKSYTSLEGEQELLFLQDTKPTYIVLYDAEVPFVRAVEIYAAVSSSRQQQYQQNAEASNIESCCNDRVRVYFLVFAASAEEKNFKVTLEREQTAFERLIQHKQTMAPPVFYNTGLTQEMNQAMELGLVGGTYMSGTLPLAFDSTTTRHGRGKLNTNKLRRDVVVDVREFRSALPSILHLNGMRLAPVTLTVGDFVLTNVHCVERKSISDLWQSFGSGRLYTQAEAMSKYYKCPCLLIEFDPNKSFSFQNQKELGIEIRTDSPCSKMVLLTMYFPRLRILWSRGPHETCKLFRDLKTNHDEPDVERSIEAGKNESEDENFLTTLSATTKATDVHSDDEEEEDDEINEVARDMLLRLPGVNVSSARKIMQEINTLSELCQLSRDDLRRIAGPVTGQKLFTFFRQKITTATSSTPTASK